MSTDQITLASDPLGFQDHRSVASDDFMPDIDGFDVEPAFIPGTDTLQLFDTYVDAFCWLADLPPLEE